MTASRLNSAERFVLVAVAICLALFVICGLAYALDERTLRGVNVWVKPMKFAASLALHLGTLLGFSLLLNEETRRSYSGQTALRLAAMTSLFEALYIALQAVRGRASHFNSDTLIETVLYQVMGMAVLVLVGASAVIGWLVLRSARPEIGPGLRFGAGLGAILSSFATLVVAGTMASGMVSGPDPWIGDPTVGGPAWPVVGWSREVGDLRVSHFIATHLVQVLPIIGWLADRGLSREAGRRLILLAAVLGMALCVATFIQALAGRPFFAA